MESIKKKKEKKKFEMPHLLWLMLGLIFVSCILTYIIPAGEFGVDENGKILAEQFSYLGSQSPVSPFRALWSIMDGLKGSATIIFIVMASGATIRVILDSKAMDDFLSWSIFKLKDKGNVLIVILYMLIVYLGGFGGSDALVAIVPVGVLFARKLKLDPIVAMGVTTYAALIGFGTGPTKQVATQMLMDVPVYSGFVTRFISMNFFMLVGLFYLMRYVKKIQKDPERSVMYDIGWRPANDEEEVDDSGLVQEVKLSWRKALIMVIFFAQYIVIVTYNLTAADSSGLYNFMAMVYMITAIVVGILSGMSSKEVAQSYVRGLQGMAFTGFVIGMARVVSIVLNDGKIIHTIVNFLTKPLMGIDRGFSSVGIGAVVTLINPMIPSASSKAAMLAPIIKPMTDALGLSGQLGVMAFQYGDAFTNLISPVLGWTVGSLATAEVPYNKWLKWAIPIIVVMQLLSFVILFVLTTMGYDGML